MIRFTARVLVPLVAIAVWACHDPVRRSIFDTSGPSPTPVPPAPAPPAPAAPRRLTGFVLDPSNTPVATANVKVTSGPTFTAVSDAAGAYAATFQPQWNGVDIVTTKVGYERTSRWVPLGSAEELSHNVRLHPILRLAAGLSLRLTINPDDSYCGFDYEYLCRTVRVTAPAAGLLTVEAVADRAGAAVGVSANPDEFLTRVRGPSLTVEVNANSETAIFVLVDWQTSTPEALTLTTMLQ